MKCHTILARFTLVFCCFLLVATSLMAQRSPRVKPGCPLDNYAPETHTSSDSCQRVSIRDGDIDDCPCTLFFGIAGVIVPCTGLDGGRLVLPVLVTDKGIYMGIYDQKSGKSTALLGESLKCTNQVQQIKSEEVNQVLNETYSILKEMESLSSGSEQYQKLERDLKRLQAKDLEIDWKPSTKG